MMTSCERAVVAFEFAPVTQGLLNFYRGEGREDNVVADVEEIRTGDSSDAWSGNFRGMLVVKIEAILRNRVVVWSVRGEKN